MRLLQQTGKDGDFSKQGIVPRLASDLLDAAQVVPPLLSISFSPSLCPFRKSLIDCQPQSLNNKQQTLKHDLQTIIADILSSKPGPHPDHKHYPPQKSSSGYTVTISSFALLVSNTES